MMTSMPENHVDLVNGWHCPRCGAVMARGRSPEGGELIQFSLEGQQGRSLMGPKWPGFGTIILLALSAILSVWLVYQYSYDLYFRAYIDSTLGPLYPFVILTMGLGGGAAVGYLLMKKRRTQPLLLKVIHPGSAAKSALNDPSKKTPQDHT